MREVKRLAKFLEKGYTEDFLESVLNATNISALREAKPNHRKDANGSIMYRKGNHLLLLNILLFKTRSEIVF